MTQEQKQEKITIQTILDWFKECVENKFPIRPQDWLDGSAKLNILRQDLDEEVVELKSKIADKQAELIALGDPVSKAKAIANSGEDYKQYLSKMALLNRIDEHIRIAKKRTELNEF